MLQGKRTRRIIAATLLTIMLTNTLAPTVSYALTSGPTAPEATSFEPIDTTDMVNLQTGDFTYNIPLLEVPGPEGGYPLSLSYHAGIQPDQDASWVGLGWALNPGAITRNVSGYPDDWHDVSQVVRDYWSGGATKTFGVNIGLALGPANVSFGLSFAHDTYKGYGVGNSVSVGVGLGKGVELSVGYTASPYGGPVTANLGVSVGFEGSQASASMGISTDGNSVEGYGGLGVAGVGISMTTEGIESARVSAPSMISVASNSRAGNIQTSSHGFNFAVGAGISLNWNYTRYWSDETANIKTHGALYMYQPDLYWDNDCGCNMTGTKINSFDTYHLHDDPQQHNIAEYPDVRSVAGGTFPDNDTYQVTSQGLGGVFRPYAFQEELYVQTVSQVLNGDGFAAGPNAGRVITAQYPAGTANSPQSQINFRFIDDFSNSYRQDPLDFSKDSYGNVYYNFDNTNKYGNNDGTYGYNLTKNKLAGSRNIEFYTNRQINSLVAKNNGFMDVNNLSARGFTRNTDDLIGGFSITNTSGVTYHYALPAYASDEVVYSENIPAERSANGYIWNKVSKPAKYAYTWFLTSITGPDFVDKNGSGTVDDGDWGYWVNFEYGKWADGFSWRNPSEGYNRDLDTRFENYSKGKKEIYYLNVIKTRSHAAVFEKNIRYDGKGTSVNSTDINSHDGSASYVFDGTSKSVMQLDKVYLLPRQNYDNMNISYTGSETGMYSNLHIPANVLDKNDIDPVRDAIAKASIKVIDFVYDNSLCDRTTNSFSYDDVGTKKGKLTLKKLITQGKGGTSIMPPLVFNYDLPANETRSGSVTFNRIGLAGTNYTMQTYASNIFEVGDVLRFERGGINYSCTVIEKTSDKLYGINMLNLGYGSLDKYSTIATTTKNPTYAVDFHDSWGMFKSDYSFVWNAINENVSRQTTSISAKNVDVWSLRNIQTPMGSTIRVNYQSDSYRKPVLNEHLSYVLSQQGSANLSAHQITFTVLSQETVPLSDYLLVGQDITPLMVAAEYGYAVRGFWFNIQNDNYGINPGHPGLKYTVAAINGNTLTVNYQIQSYDPSDLADLYNSVTDFKVIANLRLIDARNKEFYGGGIRVKNVEIRGAGSDMVKRAVYTYSNLNAGVSSGVTPYSPQVFPTYDQAAFTAMYTSGYGGFDHQADGEKAYKKALYKDVNYLLAISRELPSAGVMYEYVTVGDEVQNPDEPAARSLEGNTVFQYEVFNANMMGVKENTPYQTITYHSGAGNVQSDYTYRNMSLKNYTSRLGLLKKVIRYDNTGHKLTETISNYLHDDLNHLDFTSFATAYESRIGDVNKYNNQGVIQERFASNRFVRPNDIGTTLYIMNMREEYPAVSTGKTEINYINGTRSTTENIGYDYYSGAVTKTLTTDAYGNRLLTEVIPAYRKYSALGLKVNNGANKNMLTQEAASYVYKVDGGNQKLGLVSATVNTWSNATPVIDVTGNNLLQNSSTNGDVWRMKTAYSWKPDTKTVDGITPISDFSEYWNTTVSANWKVTSDITLYDVYSHSLEARDINGNYLTTRMDYGNKKVIASGGMANYYEIAFSGAEDAAVGLSTNGLVYQGDGNPSTGAAHTGSQGLKLKYSGQKGFVYTVSTNNLTAGRNYIANVWVKPVTGTTSDVKLYYSVNGVDKGLSVSSGLGTKQAGGWILLDLPINGADIVPNTTLVVGCRNDAGLEVYLDDFRFRPLNGNSQAYVYDAFSGELIYTLDNNNLYTKYEYDAAGRLVGTYIEKLGIGQIKTKEYQYNFGAGKWLSAAINQAFTKKDCSIGQTGTSVNITLPQGKYISFKSQADADAKAIADAQQQANALGQCQ